MTEKVVLLFAYCVVGVVAITVLTMIVQAVRGAGVNPEVMGYVWRVMDVMLGAVLTALGYRVGKQE